MGTPTRRLALFLPFLPVGIALVLPACGAGPRPPANAAADTVVAALVATIGVVDGAPEYQFGAISSVAADPGGRVYVADRLDSSVRVFDADGRFLDWIGTRGAGPGEYQLPAGIDVGPDGRVYVRDGHRITVLGPREPGAVADSVLATWPLPGYANLRGARGAVTADGRYLYPFSLYSPPRHFYIVYAGGEPRPDTLHVPAYPNHAANQPAVLPPRDGRCCRIAVGLNHTPFTALPAWTATPRGTVLSGDGIAYRIHETGPAGDTLRTILGADTVTRPVPDGERADSARALQARIDSLPVPLARVRNVPDEVREGRFPERLPAFIGLHLGTDGRIWVERWPPEHRGDERFFDVLGPDGARLAVVVVPAALSRDVPPFLTTDRIYGVVADPATGVERVVVARYHIAAPAVAAASADAP
ncbi:MAG TPA: 6-bladed beta-propeller [Longimicrobiales bacterium]